MKPIFITLILVTAIFTVTTYSIKAQTPEQLYQKGLLKEEGEGALQDAINLYSQVADNSKADKSLQAKALLHVGLCYEKLGNQEAVKTYTRLVSNFPTQKNEVAIARERLSKLITVESSKEITIRQVWTGKGVDQLGSVSADGEHLTFVDWETGNLAIRNLKTGENKPLTNEGTWKEPSQYALYSNISPDATRVVYMWSVADGTPDFRLIKVGNPTPVILYTPEDKDEAMAPGLWFSDGDKIIVQKFNRNNKSWQLFLMNLITREIKLLKEIIPGPNYPSDLSLSPDEKQIAYSIPNSADNNKSDINLLSIDSKLESLLIKHPANDQLVGWLPGRNELLFTSDRSGTTDLWVVNTSNAKSFDMPQRILTNIGGISPLGFQKNGTLFYGTQSDIFESFVLPLDQNTGKLSDSPRTTLSGQVFDICWLPDGESLVCRQYPQNRNYTLGIYNRKTGVIRTLADNIIAVGSGSISPDGKSILVLGIDKQGYGEKGYVGGIYSVDIKTGIPVGILLFSKDIVPGSKNVEWDKEGKNIFYVRANQIVKRNIETGEEKILYTDKNLSFSPTLRRSFDGTHLVITGALPLNESGKLNENQTYLLSIPEDGGEARILCSADFSGILQHRNISLSPDGKYIYFCAKTPVIKSVLYRIPEAGGAPEIIWQSKDYNLSGISIHPDGKQIGLSTSVYQAEISVIENLGRKVTEVFAKDE